MIYAILKNQGEKEQLDKALDEARGKNLYRRLMVIKLSVEGWITRHISKHFQLSETTIRSYIHKYNQGGLEKLEPRKRTGRPPKIANWTKGQWDEVLGQTPNQYEKLDTQSRAWTLELMVKYLKEYRNINVSISSIHNSLKKTKRRTGRSKLHVSSPDPDYQVKRRHVEVLQGLPKRGN